MVGEVCAGHRSVHPVVASEADPRAQLVVDARVPVDRQDNDDAEDADTQGVRVVGERFGALEELGEATEAQQAIQTDVRR